MIIFSERFQLQVIIPNLKTDIWLQVFLSNKKKLLKVIWQQVFLSTTINLHTVSSIPILYK